MNLTFDYTDGFSILKNNKIVFCAKVGSSVGEIGFKENSFKMSHGSFKIRDRFLRSTRWIVSKIEGDEKTAKLFLNVGFCVLKIEDGKRIRAEFFETQKFNFMKINLPSKKDEGFYGCGELFSEFNLKGKKVNVWVAEHINALSTVDKIIQRALGAKDKTFKKDISKYETYYARPTFISSEKYFFHSETTARSIFDFSSDNLTVLETDSIAPFYVGFGDDFEALSENLSEILGRRPELPEWVFEGRILGVRGGTETMMKKLETAQNAGIDVCGIWIRDWEGRRVTAVGKRLFWNWEWDSELYPGLDEKIKELRQKNIRVLGYCNPFLAIEKPLYKYASEKGYCVKDKNGDDYLVKITTFPASMVDFTNPDARNWIKGIIKKNLIEFGFSGWMADFGEYLPTDCVLFSGEDPELVHNTWPAIWAKINREAVEECGKLGEIMFFTRAGFSGTPSSSTMMWNGDNHVDFTLDYGLGSVIPAALSLSCSGFGLCHSDIGGYTTFSNLRRSKELYMRWCEMNAYSLLMRGHEGLNPDLNARFDFDEEVLSHGAKMTAEHKKLAPYLKSLVKENAEKGIGVVRPLFFYYDEPEAKDEKFEYLLGRDVLVAPVLEPNAKKRNVYLPDDEWINIENGKLYYGGKFEIDAPLGTIPVFVRAENQELSSALLRNN